MYTTTVSPGVEQAEAKLWRGSASILAGQRKTPSPHSFPFFSAQTDAYWSKYSYSSGAPGQSIPKMSPSAIRANQNLVVRIPSGEAWYKSIGIKSYLFIS